VKESHAGTSDIGSSGFVRNDPVGRRLRGSREKTDALASDDLSLAALETAGRVA
jgi:hypothetical protein